MAGSEEDRGLWTLTSPQSESKMPSTVENYPSSDNFRMGVYSHEVDFWMPKGVKGSFLFPIYQNRFLSNLNQTRFGGSFSVSNPFCKVHVRWPTEQPVPSH